MILYLQEVMQNIYDCMNRRRAVILMSILFLAGMIIGINSVDAQCIIVDTSSGEYIVLIMSSGNIGSVFLALLFRCCILAVLMWLVSFRYYTNFIKFALGFFLGYYTGVSIATIALLYGVVATIVLCVFYFIYMLALLLAVCISYCSCCDAYGCDGRLDYKSSLIFNWHSYLIIIGAVLSLLLILFVLIRPIFGVI